jgi:hypothetical protein
MKSFTVTAIVISLFLFIMGFTIRIGLQKDKERMEIKSSFVVESGPEEIGYSKFTVIRYIESGKRFIFIEKGNAVTTVTLN